MRIFAACDRAEWRSFLEEHFTGLSEVWLVFPTKASGEAGISYNDAVEEALCFGWIDGRAGKLDETHSLRRFTPRRKGSPYSRPNIERLIRMEELGRIHPSVREEILPVIREPFAFPPDILETLRREETVWENYLRFPEPYRRIRVAYIDAARNRPEEFARRLKNFVEKTRQGKIIRGYGGVEQYYA
ncbi:MAG: YdeI/OmpD-associated family protein [Clostridia bacterium]|nr:YdeI/OmpD-associated family protein [Clostridia bacterium]